MLPRVRRSEGSMPLNKGFPDNRRKEAATKSLHSRLPGWRAELPHPTILLPTEPKLQPPGSVIVDCRLNSSHSAVDALFCPSGLPEGIPPEQLVPVRTQNCRFCPLNATDQETDTERNLRDGYLAKVLVGSIRPKPRMIWSTNVRRPTFVSVTRREMATVRPSRSANFSMLDTVPVSSNEIAKT